MEEKLKTPNKETVTPKAETGNFVRPEWLAAYYKGNSLIPQTDVGIQLCLAIGTILEDPSMDWKKFEASELSFEQVDFLGKVMSDQHRQKGIMIGVEERAITFSSKPLIVDKGTLRDFWRGYRERTLHMLRLYINYITDYNVDKIVNFFNDPHYQDKVEELKKILSIIKASLEKPEMAKLLATYRSELGKGEERGGKHWRNNYHDRFAKILKTDIMNALNGSLPPGVIYLIKEN